MLAEHIGLTIDQQAGESISFVFRIQVKTNTI